MPDVDWPEPADEPADEPAEPWAYDRPDAEGRRHHWVDQEDDGEPD
jgi:hypothetical protein